MTYLTIFFAALLGAFMGATTTVSLKTKGKKMGNKIIKYRKKSDEVDAWQLTKENYSRGAPPWVRHSDNKIQLWSQYADAGKIIITGKVETSKGWYAISENDYIVKDTNDELTVYKPDIFEQTYEEVQAIDNHQNY